ncbi:hypothetical protein Lesp02_42190 [Lentzea sp. NBRC 105346]|nr:hypothetical protein Lesp02_42190 [Lentzea sp. NBRC 105346]
MLENLPSENGGGQHRPEPRARRPQGGVRISGIPKPYAVSIRHRAHEDAVRRAGAEMHVQNSTRATPRERDVAVGVDPDCELKDVIEKAARRIGVAPNHFQAKVQR